jgi:hypothetical protein
LHSQPVAVAGAADIPTQAEPSFDGQLKTKVSFVLIEHPPPSA